MSDPESPLGDAATPDSPDDADPGARSRSERLHRRRRKRNHKRIIVTLTSLVVVALVLGIAGYLQITGSFSRTDLTRGIGDRPKVSTTKDPETNLTALNILVTGSDSRAKGESGNGRTSSIAGARSDTSLVVHLAADRKSAIVVSIPRDSMTKAPSDCDDPNSRVADGPVRQWNDNFARGGEACVAKTLEGLTGILVDHSVTVDFSGFKSMVDALGGVEICTPEAIKDKDAHLDIPAGRQLLKGDEALGYVRVRHALGDGSDIGRIERQQVFLASMVQAATKTELLLRPDKLYRFLLAASRATTLDEGLDVGTLTDIAESLRTIGLDNIRFLTVPIEGYAPDPNRVQWAPTADALWEAIRLDQPLPGTAAATPTTPPTTSTTTTPALTVAPDDISLRVVNDSGVEGLAVQAGNALRPQGFKVDGLLNGDGEASKGVTIRYTSAQAAAANTVAAAFPGAKLVRVTTPQNSIEVVLGTGAPAVVAVPNRTGSDPLPSQPITATPPASSTPSFTARAADTDICT